MVPELEHIVSTFGFVFGPYVFDFGVKNVLVFLMVSERLFGRLWGGFVESFFGGFMFQFYRKNSTKQTFKKRTYSLSDLSWTGFGPQLGSFWEASDPKMGTQTCKNWFRN